MLQPSQAFTRNALGRNHLPSTQKAMFLINSQIPQKTNSSSTLEPILLPKLQIKFAEFPHNPYSSCTGITPGYLMRYRYDNHPSFSSEQTPPTQAPSHHNNPDPIPMHPQQTHQITPRYVKPDTENIHPSSSSHLIEQPHTTIKASPFTQSIHSPQRETLIQYTNHFLLLLPRSAHIAPPHPFT